MSAGMDRGCNGVRFRIPGAGMLLGGLVAASLLAACHRTSCGGPDGCPSDSVCQLDGTCAPLGAGPDIRFARVHRLYAVDWGTTRADRPSRVVPDDDTLAVGGDVDAAAYLEFGPLPSGIERAVLTLSPRQVAPADARLVVRRTGMFEGERLTHRDSPSHSGARSVARGVHAHASHPVRFDVSELVATATGGSRLHLVVHVVRPWDGVPWRLSSPRAGDPARRPQLEVLQR